MNINIAFPELFDVVSRSLSIIGKRSVDENGNRLFEDITIGTNEKEIINDFFTNGISELVAELSRFISVEYYNNGITKTQHVKYWQDNSPTASKGAYWYKPSTKSLYVSSESAWYDATISTDTAYVDPQGVYYWWHNYTMERIGTGVGGSVTIGLDMYSNWNTALEFSVVTTTHNYLVAYALYSWFTVTAPKIVDKYLGEKNSQLATLIRLIHEKKANVGTDDIISKTSVSMTPTYKLFKQSGSYYRWGDGENSMTKLTDDEVAALTDDQKAGAITIP